MDLSEFLIILINQNVSKRLGCIKDSATDIHYIEDLNKAKQKCHENILRKLFRRNKNAQFVKLDSKNYQKGVGMNAYDRLHKNSIELTTILIKQYTVKGQFSF